METIGKLNLLLQAAEFLENQDKRDREAEHGYAAPAYRYEDEPLRTKIKAIRRSQNRTTHNELEKNRRAHLRSCLENLKDIVPLGDQTRHTTLGLLNQACHLIKSLEDSSRQLALEKSQQEKYHQNLKQTLQRLEVSRRRRNSTGSAWSSSHSESSNDSDKDEEIIDVTDCSDDPEPLPAPSVPLRTTNLITINVAKPLTLPARAVVTQVKRMKQAN